MRWFFSLLVLTNLTLAGWLYWHNETSSAQPAQPNSIPGQRLQLLSELPPQSLQSIPHNEKTIEPLSGEPSADTPNQTVQSSTPNAVDEEHKEEQSVSCIRISPITSTVEADVLAGKLTQKNLEILDRGEDLSERETFWVMIPPYKNANAARDAAALLAKAKVRDFLIVSSGEYKNGISLGLFSQKEGADNRLQEILALKLNFRQPEIRLRTSSVRSYWFLVRMNSVGAIKALQQEISPDGLLTVPVECPQ